MLVGVHALIGDAHVGVQDPEDLGIHHATVRRQIVVAGQERGDLVAGAEPALGGVAGAVTTTVRTLHRVYQISPTDESMAALLDAAALLDVMAERTAALFWCRM